MSTVLDLIDDLLKPESRPMSPNARQAENRADFGESPQSPLSPVVPVEITATAESAELRRLVRQCGELYNFTEEEHRDALEIALADHESALTCFRAMAAEIGILGHG